LELGLRIKAETTRFEKIEKFLFSDVLPVEVVILTISSSVVGLSYGQFCSVDWDPLLTVVEYDFN
jgi:hypothetical protein